MCNIDTSVLQGYITLGLEGLDMFDLTFKNSAIL